jgi:hypothetical protein
LHRSVRESLAGRASYFDLDTLSVHELARAGKFRLIDSLLRGGWPELYRTPGLDPVRYLSDLLGTFAQRDIVLAAGIERRDALGVVLRWWQLASASSGMCPMSPERRREVSTVQAWCRTLEDKPREAATHDGTHSAFPCVASDRVSPSPPHAHFSLDSAR